MSLTPLHLYQQLSTFFGHQKWWPVDTEYHKIHGTDPRGEIIIGTILTQNTTWKNVEQVIDNLKKTHNLSINKIVQLSNSELRELIKSSGYYNQKTARLKGLMVYFVDNYNSNLTKVFSKPLYEIRNELLTINGIGPETADSILLYAGEYPVFVVDAYTKRISQRMPILLPSSSYEEIQHVFQKDLTKNYNDDNLIFVYQQLHALLVELAKSYCKTKPDCVHCPLKNRCAYIKLDK
jgi:endonuclease-3 related protein